MTPEQRVKAAQKASRTGAGPRIVTQTTVDRLKQSSAPKHLIESAQRAMRSNPV